MSTVFLLRRDSEALRLTQAAIQATSDLRVVDTAASLFHARPLLTKRLPALMVSDIRLSDGALLTLLLELNQAQAAAPRPKVLLIVPSVDDPLLVPSLKAGAEGYVVDAPGLPLAAAIRRTMRGEASMPPALAAELLRFFGEPLAPSARNERQLDWQTDALNPLMLSSGERHLLALLAQGLAMSEIAVRMALSVESIGRRIANVYRKWQWDVRSGSLALHAA